MDELLTDRSQIRGQIYLMKNIETNLQYIGQTVTHRKNHSKYRPFGYIGRFKDHISEAMCNTKRKQCWYLNNAIRKYGKDNWSIELIQECSLEELDDLEQFYITKYNTLYPFGYNLTRGGKTLKTLNHDFTEEVFLPKKRGGCKFRSEETRLKMSKRSSEISNLPEVKEVRSKNAKINHLHKKLEKFKDEKIDPLNLDQYITYKKGLVTICINNKYSYFNSKGESQDASKNRALEFLRTLATLPNCWETH